MTELFRLLVGTCSLYWCSFAVDHIDDQAYLKVRVYDKGAEIITVERYSMDDLIFGEWVAGE